MRLGFILGFLIGGGIASLMTKMQEEAGAAQVVDGSGKPVNPALGRVKQHLNDAREAAREAKLEKEAEMHQMLDDMVHRKTAS